ncbi:FAD-binding and (Fe-S)-binding domain-containing protein [Neisseriaceae bacterium CLB008]
MTTPNLTTVSLKGPEMTQEHPIDAAHQAFIQALGQVLPAAQIHSDLISRYAYGTDASFYRYVPQVVVRAHNETEVQTILRLAQSHQVAVTFRASGTSLSGQACSQSVLVLMGDGFLTQEVLDDGLRIKLGPMVIGAAANQTLLPFGRKIGPDPASINTARIGGIAANNSSGMCCGTRANSYHTLDSLRIVFADGAILDTADQASIDVFRHSHGPLLNQVQTLAQNIKENPALAERVRHKYRMKNTTGYGINALLDFDDPIDMLTHLMIGSEGTLGFISEVVYHTVPDHQNKASAFIFFESLDTCCRAVTALRQQDQVDAVELFDALSLRYIGREKSGLPSLFYADFDDDAACLLIETKAENGALLQQQISAINALLKGFDYAEHTGFQTDHAITDQYWAVRKGYLPIVAGSRPKGSNLITEDVVFPIERLAEGVRELTQLLVQFGYDEAMVMGHALEGNLHFILTPMMDDPTEVQRFEDFMQALAQLVAIDFQGSLKGEHGTGRNIAPFVRTEWGDELYAIMCDLKTLLDPHNALNPDVIISSNERIHVSSLKDMPQANELIDHCMECGFCEPACPSNGLTLTPRQRITAYRYLSQLSRQGLSPSLLNAYQDSFDYKGIQTCAETGMCATRCPVSINTGTLIKQLRPESKRLGAANWVKNHMASTTALARFGIKAAHMVGLDTAHQLSQKAHRRYPTLPIVPLSLPQAAPKLPQASVNGCDPVVYFVSCVNRVVAEGDGRTPGQHLAQHTLNLFRKAGFNAIYPDQMNQLCCGQPFESAKAASAASDSATSLNQALLSASNYGLYPVYLDNAPCALRVKEAQQQGLIDARLQLYDAASFLAEQVLPKLTLSKPLPELALHIPCSATKMGAGHALKTLANACTNSLTTPDIACCGFAGSKGFSLPELNANGLRNLNQALPESCQHGVSMSKTCQIGLTTHSGRPYQSIEALLDQCSQ